MLGAGDLVALAIVVCGIAVGCVVIGRLLDRVERVVRLLETYDAETRAGFRRVDERVDDLHRSVGRLDVLQGGRGPRGG